MSQRREALPRLSISMQQPPAFSPALPTSLQTFFPLQTPVHQTFFVPQGTLQRPTHSSAQLAAAGIHPPPLFTPVAGHFPRPSVVVPNVIPSPAPNRNRHHGRQLSVGGPPKALLGGPSRKVSPLPGALGPNATGPPSVAVAAASKMKKVIVNLPKESGTHWERVPLPLRDDILITPPECTTVESYPPDQWRLSLPLSIDVYLPGKVAWEEIKRKSIEEKLVKLGVERGSVPHIHAPHARAASISSPADPALLMFKLNKLHQAQEITAASSSATNSLSVSPQPFLGGLSPSPSHRSGQPPRFNANNLRHGHSMSLFQPSSHQPYSNTPSPFNPYGHKTESNTDTQSVISESDPIYAPQGRIPLNAIAFGPSIPPPLSAVGGDKSHVDFIRGFGLDTPLESEEEEEDKENQKPNERSDGEYGTLNGIDKSQDMDVEDGETADVDDATTTAPHTRLHSRHVSKLSTALSLRSVGGNFTAEFASASGVIPVVIEAGPIDGEVTNNDVESGEEDAPQTVAVRGKKPHEIDPVDEWTGSEDLHLGGQDTPDEESIGEWSNPSDEERARHQRVERRMTRKAALQQQRELVLGMEVEDKPRRLPAFPRPPEGSLGFINSQREDDIISNPSEEERYVRPAGRRAEFVGVTTEEYVPEVIHHAFVHPPPPPPVPLTQDIHSRVPSAGQYSMHDPAMAHSRHGSGNLGNFPVPQPGFAQPPYSHHHQPQFSQLSQYHQSSASLGGSANTSTGPRRDSLNPFAKPFVFGASASSTLPLIQPMVPQLISSLSHHSSRSHSQPVTSTHMRMPSLGKPLNVAAPEFKPGQFNFRLPAGAPQMPGHLTYGPIQPPPPPPQLLHHPNLSNLSHHSHGCGQSIIIQDQNLLSTESSPFKVQGREKRQRRGSTSSMIEEGDSMLSFKFPMKIDPAASSTPHRLKEHNREKARRNSNASEVADSGDLEECNLNLNLAAQPFTFAGFSAVANNMPWVPKEHEEALSPRDLRFGVGSNVQVEGHTKPDGDDNGSIKEEEDEEGMVQEVVVPATRPKCAPIPLDFKLPVSTNTVPAGVFKALNNTNNNNMNNNNNGSGDDRTRHSVRSRLSSREIFHQHMPRPSMNDNEVASITQRPRTRLVTDPGERPTLLLRNRDKDWDTIGGRNEGDDVFGSVVHVRRRSSLPDALRDVEEELKERERERDQEEDEGDMSLGSAIDLPNRMEMVRLEHLIGQLLDDKLGELKGHLHSKTRNGEAPSAAVSESMEATMKEVISLLRVQMPESAARGMEDSQMDARGELDFQIIKDILQEGHQDLMATLQGEIRRLVLQEFPSAVANNNVGPDVLIPMVEDVGNRTIGAVVEAISELSARQEATALNAPSREHDLIVEKLLGVLSPLMHSLRTDPIDYEFLTRELSQAVKPHISQLIDLASDKRETANLIVDRILPLLPSMSNFSVDTDAITLKLITEVRRAIAPIDAFEIKEQVADLVVERLDSRLAVRDKVFNVDVVTAKVKDSIAQLLERLSAIPGVLDQMNITQKDVVEKQGNFAESQELLVAFIKELPGKVRSQLEEIKMVQNDILQKVDKPFIAAVPVSDEPDPNILVIKNTVDALSSEQKKFAADQLEATVSQNQLLLDRLNGLPQEFSGIASNLRSALADLIASGDKSKRELEELRKLNTDYQIQVTKARGSHGQVRVEKDVLSEKLAIIEADRDRLRTQTTDLQNVISTNSANMETLAARNLELEEALSKALNRLQVADVATQADQCSIVDFKKVNEELKIEKDALKSKIVSLEMEAAFATNERETTSNALHSLQKKYDHLESKTCNWDALEAATEKINSVYQLLENNNHEAHEELKQYHDLTKSLENEKSSMQKQVKDLESKLANNERSAITVHKTLTQAQQRSMEWENRAKEYEGQLELVRTQLEQAEQTQSQLESDYSLTKLQVEEQEADNRLHADRENKLREQITALESKCSLLQNELAKATSARIALTASAAPFRPQTNGNNSHPERPDSRTSTVYDARGDTAGRRVSSYASNRSVTSVQSLPQHSVWDSMHAPTNKSSQNMWSSPATMRTPAARYSSLAPSTPKAQHKAPYNQNKRGPSPTPSTVSAAPTQGKDGWWE